MEDAYEVGIRLVLENGVSAGIATLQNDLAAYDRALTATTGRLRTVAEAARGLQAPVGAGGAGPAVHSAAKRAEAEPPDVGQARGGASPVPAPVMPLAAPLVSALATPAPAASLATTAKPPPMPALAPVRPPLASAAVPASAVPRMALDEQGSAPRQAAPRPLPGFGQAVPPAAGEARQGQLGVAPAPGRGQVRAAVTVMAVQPPRYARYAPAAPAGQPPAVTAAVVPEGGFASISLTERPAEPLAAVGGRDPVRGFAWNAAPSRAEPAASVGMQVAPRPTVATAAGAAPAAPMATAAASGPVQGDVYLDGARVGRWMSDRLAREVNRPQGGVTGFDPRLGPAWPGSLHGT